MVMCSAISGVLALAACQVVDLPIVYVFDVEF